MNANLLLTGLLQGLTLALVTYAIMIPFRILHFPDLTAEGAYPLGGAVCSSLLLLQLPPLLATLAASLLTGFAGIATGLINLKLRVNSLLAGIIVSTMLYSLNLRLLGKPNVALFATNTLFNSPGQPVILTLLGLVTLIIVPLLYLAHTRLGLNLRAVGLNPQLAKRLGLSVQSYTLSGLFLASALTGMAGSLVVQLQQYMDVGMGLGIAIHALAALMIGEALLGNQTLNKQLLAPLVGALIYQQILGFILSLGLPPSDLKFFTGALVLIIIALHKGDQHEQI